MYHLHWRQSSYHHPRDLNKGYKGKKASRKKEKKRKVYAGHRPRALKKVPLTSKLARAPPE
eukprot:976058-Pelagomonas_calceolata.AAC.1